MKKMKIALGIILFYFVTLIGCFTNNSTESINNLPTVSLTANPNSGTEPLTVQLTANANDSDGSIVKFEWDFDGDGTYDRSTSNNTVSYTYHKGTYTPKVIVTDNVGAIAEATTQVIVNAMQDTTGGTTGITSTSYTSAQSTLQSLGLAISIPTISDFADTTGSNAAALTSVFSGNDSKTTNFDSTKFSGLESAISDLQSSLVSYTSAPKNNLSLSPSWASSSYKNSDFAYVHFLLGYYYTVHAVLKLRVFVGNIVQVIGARYVLNWNAYTLNNVSDSGRQAVLDAYFMLNGVRYQVNNSAGNGLIYANKNLPAGPTKCASYHLDQAVIWGGNVFPQLKIALEKLRSESFKAFFDEISAKMTTLGITQLATN